MIDWHAAKDALSPNPFSTALPLQLWAWDNTALQTLIHCPRHYLYSVVRGLRGSGGSVHLTFGTIVHDCADLFVKARASGISDDDALDAAVDHALRASWPEDSAQDAFGGAYSTVYQCRDRTRTVTKKGIQRCPQSFREHIGEGPCPACGGPVDQRIAYLTTEKVKNRRTLLRTVVELCDALARSNIRTMVLPDGRIGSELRWFRELPIPGPDGRNYVMTGSFDGVAQAGEAGGVVIPEYKTSGREPDDKFWLSYEMSPQVHTYAWAGVEEFGPSTQVMVFAAHVGPGHTEIWPKRVYISADRLAEWQEDLIGVIQEGELRARLAQQLEGEGRDPSAAYPRRLSACASLPGASTTPCPFRSYCKLDRADREDFIAANFEVAHWSPLGTKGAVAQEVVE